MCDYNPYISAYQTLSLSRVKRKKTEKKRNQGKALEVTLEIHKEDNL